MVMPKTVNVIIIQVEDVQRHNHPSWMVMPKTVNGITMQQYFALKSYTISCQPHCYILGRIMKRLLIFWGEVFCFKARNKFVLNFLPAYAPMQCGVARNTQMLSTIWDHTRGDARDVNVIFLQLTLHCVCGDRCACLAFSARMAGLAFSARLARLAFSARIAFDISQKTRENDSIQCDEYYNKYNRQTNRIDEIYF